MQNEIPLFKEAVIGMGNVSVIFSTMMLSLTNLYKIAKYLHKLQRVADICASAMLHILAYMKTGRYKIHTIIKVNEQLIEEISKISTFDSVVFFLIMTQCLPVLTMHRRQVTNRLLGISSIRCPTRFRHLCSF